MGVVITHCWYSARCMPRSLDPRVGYREKVKPVWRHSSLQPGGPHPPPDKGLDRVRSRLARAGHGISQTGPCDSSLREAYRPPHFGTCHTSYRESP